MINLLYVILIALSLSSFAEDYTKETQKKIITIHQETQRDLSNGNTDAARNRLEQAAGNFHAVEIELGLIQTLMQAGEYRHALAAAAHTQAEHPNAADSTLFYAWLLAIGGQVIPATELLGITLEYQPNSDALLRMQQQCNSRRLISTEINTSNAIQLQPITRKQNKENSRHYLTTGIVINNGTGVIVPFSELKKQKSVVVLNRLGKITRAHLDYANTETNIALLKLSTPISYTPATFSNKNILAGKPIYIIGFSSTNRELPDWPQLKTDVLSNSTSASGENYIIHAPLLTAGAGIYNTEGDLIGISSGEKNRQMIPVSNVITHNGNAMPSTHLTMDEIYEMALNNTVKVFARN